MTFTMPDVAATRAAMVGAYDAALRALVEDATQEVPGGEWDGVPVVTRRALDEAVGAVFGAAVPAPDATWAEVSTPATVIVWAGCPRCGIAQPISVQVRPELLIDDTGSELRVKAKAKGRTHLCGQLPLTVSGDDGQMGLELEALVGERCGEAMSEGDTLVEGGPACILPAGHDGDHAAASVADDATDTGEGAGLDALYGIVARGETLDEAWARIERLPDFARIASTPAGQELNNRIIAGHGSVVPFPADPA